MTVAKLAKKANRENEKQKKIVQLRAKYRDSEKSRKKWRKECLALRKENKELKSAPLGPSSAEYQACIKIGRHKYNLLIVSLCIHLYVIGGCSLRGVVQILNYLNIVLGWGMKELPSKSSIENWLLKAGLYCQESAFRDKYPDGYAVVVDESMVIGQERMLAVLGIPAEKEENKAVDFSDADVLALKVLPSWKQEDVSEVLRDVRKKMGKRPVYGICDGASNLKSGLKGAKVKRVMDVGHEIARLAEQTYAKSDDYQAFSKALSEARFKEIMKPTAYLLPPKQRTIARFMNLSPVLDWYRKMIFNFPCLKPEEWDVFGFIYLHKPIADELIKLKGLTDQLLDRFKNSGLSHDNIKWALKLCRNAKKTAEGKLLQVIEKLITYWKTERSKLPPKQESQKGWHCSSDIIESMFGYYKLRKASNGLHGVTPFALIMPLLTRKSADSPILNLNIKEAMETVFLTNIDKWNKDNLIENQVCRRTRMLRI